MPRTLMLTLTGALAWHDDCVRLDLTRDTLWILRNPGDFADIRKAGEPLKLSTYAALPGDRQTRLKAGDYGQFDHSDTHFTL